MQFIRRSCDALLLSVLLLVVAMLGSVFAATSPAALSASCTRAAEEASQRSGVPISVLKAISYNESGRKVEGGFGPWPWTVNMEGAGHFFDTFADARAYVAKEYARGARSFDVGCFQINYRWHGEAFELIDQMFEPLANAMYAARFLAELHAETGSWNAAAGAYHSRTKVHADRYSARFASVRQKFLSEDQALGVGAPLTAMVDDRSLYGGGGYDGIPEIPDIVTAMYGPEKPAKPRVNTYPLLQRRGDVRPPSGVAPGASLFSTLPGEAEPEPVDDMPLSDAMPSGGVGIARIAQLGPEDGATAGSLLGNGFLTAGRIRPVIGAETEPAEPAAGDQ
ncbi:hypothetical protein [Paenirhodobacter sp.]|uniref:hypothetical protein n=1 Tax=Paenirhodobacter sp. TaxID=1965326 RepID=UPI003B41BADD